MNFGLGIGAALGITLFILGCIGMNKRKIIYDECAQYFGFIKAYIFLTCITAGCIFTIFDIMRLIGADDGTAELVGIPPFVGMLLLALGVIIGIFTSKRAREDGVNGVVMKMILAGCGSVVSIMARIFGIFLPIIADHAQREHERYLQEQARREAELEAKRNTKVWNSETGEYYKVSRDGEHYYGDDGEWHPIRDIKKV